MNRTKEEAAETKGRLLEAAYRLFMLDGFEKTTLSGIAAEAGLTRGAVYWHFTDKNDVLNQLVINILDELRSDQHQQIENETLDPYVRLLSAYGRRSDMLEKMFFINRVYWMLNQYPEFQTLAASYRAHKRYLFQVSCNLLEQLAQDRRYTLTGKPRDIAVVVFALLDDVYACNSFQLLQRDLQLSDLEAYLHLMIKENTD